jgi:hypothetical protein
MTSNIGQYCDINIIQYWLKITFLYSPVSNIACNFPCASPRFIDLNIIFISTLSPALKYADFGSTENGLKLLFLKAILFNHTGFKNNIIIIISITYHLVIKVKPAETIPMLCTVINALFSIFNGVIGIVTESGKSKIGLGPIAKFKNIRL